MAKIKVGDCFKQLEIVSVKVNFEQVKGDDKANITGIYNPSAGTFRMERAEDLSRDNKLSRLTNFAEGLKICTDELQSAEFFIKTKSKNLKQTNKI
jgi:hypothetical protein